MFQLFRLALPSVRPHCFPRDERELRATSLTVFSQTKATFTVVASTSCAVKMCRYTENTKVIKPLCLFNEILTAPPTAPKQDYSENIV